MAIDNARLQTDYNYRQSLRDAGNWVGDDGSGNAVVEGPAAGGSAPSSGGGGAPAPAPAPVSNPFAGLFNAQNQSNQEDFALQKQAASDAHDKAVQDLQLATNADQRAQALLNIQQAQQTLAELTQKEAQQNFQQTQYTNLAQSLLTGASALRGPADWAQYTKYVTGGRNLNDSLFGSTPSPQFGAPAGYSPAVSVQGVLGDLGYGTGGTNGFTPQTPIGQQVPLPHQWDPATWDSMPATAQQLVLGLAQAGNTSSGAWDPNDYLKQINAARPQGSASTSTAANYAAPASSF